MIKNSNKSNLEAGNKEMGVEMTDPKERKRFWKAIAALSFAMINQSYYLISVFPYAGFFAMKLVPSLTTNTAGTYAGLIASFYMVGRMLTAIIWGKIADTIGRKPVYYWTFAFSGFFSIWFGLSTNIYSALFARFMMGFGNGLLVTTKTIVSELAKKDKKLETKGLGIVMGMWGWGFIVCPVMSGYISDPVKQYPNLQIVENYKPFLSAYPFILPNLVSVILCVFGFIFIYYFVDETLPEEKKKPITSLLKGYKNTTHKKSNDELLPLRESKLHDKTNYTTSEKQVDNKNTDTKNTENESVPPTIAAIWAQPKLRHHIITHMSLVFSGILIDEAFPLFCIAGNVGLNLNEAGIGNILSGAGILFIVGHFVFFGKIVDYFGLYSSVKLGALFASPIVILMPLSMTLNEGVSPVDNSIGITLSAYILLMTIMGLKNIAKNLAMTNILIGMNRSVSQEQRATMNGLATSGGSFAKALGPAIAGFLVSFLLGSGYFSPTWGAYLLFGFISATGWGVFVYVILVLKQYY